MKSLLRRFEVMTIEQELFWILLVSGLALAAGAGWMGYHLYQSRPCGCMPGGDNTEKLDPDEKNVGTLFVLPRKALPHFFLAKL